jgi:hypothetical protein
VQSVSWRLAAYVGAILFVFLISPAFGVDDLWSNKTGNWDDGTKWSLGRPPVNGESAWITSISADQTLTITSGTIPIVATGLNLLLLDGSSSSTMTLLQQGSSLYATDELIALSYKAHFAQSAGSNTASNNMFVGYTTNSTGTYSLSGSSTLTVGSDLYVGYDNDAAGTFIQSGGLATISGGIYLGNLAVTNGWYNFSGGTLSAAFLAVGADGRGTFTQTGGVGTLSGNLYVGAGTTAGTMSISGGEMHVLGATGVGGALYGSLDITDGTLDTHSHLVMQSHGTLTQSGGYTSVGGDLYLGLDVYGSAIYLNGGQMHVTGDTLLGSLTNAYGTIAIGGGSFNAHGDLVVQSHGTLTQTAGELSISGNFFIGNNSTGTVNTVLQGTQQIGGQTVIGTETQGYGSLTIQGKYYAHSDVFVLPRGTLTLDNFAENLFSIDSGRGLWIEGGRADFKQSYGLGNGVTLSVSNGGTFTSTEPLDVGNSLRGGAIGTLVVDGAMCIISDGADGLNHGPMRWGSQPGDNASILITDGGRLSVSGLKIADAGGTATVNIQNGARLVPLGTFTIGGAAGSSATINVDGGRMGVPSGGVFSNGAVVNVNSGTFTYFRMTVESGAKLNILGGTIITDNGGSGGNFTVDGGEGSFTISHKIKGPATFSILNGGLFQSTRALDITNGDQDIAGIATLTVTGQNSRMNVGLSGLSTDFSSWAGFPTNAATINFANSGAGTFNAGLHVAAEGSASINIASSAAVYVKSGLDVGGGTTSLVNFEIDGGTLTSRDSTSLRKGTDIILSAGGMRLQETSSIELGATVHWNGGTLELQNTTVGGNILLSSGNNKVFRATSLDVTTTGKIDLSDNPMILDYSGSSPAQSIRLALQRGRSASPTNGLTSSFVAADLLHRALGYIESSTLLGPAGGTFANQNVDGTALLIKYTLPGDTDLNGAVDAVDLGKLALHWNNTGTWIDGDFDYSGSIDVRDLYLLASNWKSTLPGAPAPALSPDLDLLLTSFGLPPVEVPEPTAAAALLALGACALRRRR